jgi:sugar lactone lactonase YvrE
MRIAAVVAALGLIAARGQTVSTFIQAAAGVTSPVGLAFDTNGNLYVSWTKVTVSGGNPAMGIPPTTTFTPTVSEYSNAAALVSASYAAAGNLSNIAGLAFDTNGNLYATGGSAVGKISAGNQSYITGLSSPAGLAFDPNGNLYVANNGNGNITKYTSTGAAVTTGVLTPPIFASTSTPYGLAFDASGNLYVSNNDGTGVINKISSAGTVSTFYTFGAGTNPTGLAIDAVGSLYVAGSGNNTITKLSSGGALLYTLSLPAGSSPKFLAFDASGNLYVANYQSSTVSLITLPAVVVAAPPAVSTPAVTAIPPVITSPLTYTSPVNQTFSYTIFASNAPTSYNATNVPPGCYINTYTGGITGTPTIAGVYTETISASNAGGTGTAQCRPIR